MVVRRTISISEEDAKWLNEHPYVNLSGIVQSSIRKIRSNGDTSFLNDFVGD